MKNVKGIIQGLDQKVADSTTDNIKEHPQDIPTPLVDLVPPPATNPSQNKNLEDLQETDPLPDFDLHLIPALLPIIQETVNQSAPTQSQK